jgi:hypothetical protein
MEDEGAKIKIEKITQGGEKMKIRSLLIVAIGIGLLAAAFSGPVAAAPAFRIAVVMPSAKTDMSFSQSMFDALKAVQKEMGGEAALQIAYSEDMFKVPDAAAAIRDYASQGFNIVIAHGSQYGSSVQEIAKDFPKTAFAWGTHVDTFGLPNVYQDLHLRLHTGCRVGGSEYPGCEDLDGLILGRGIDGGGGQDPDCRGRGHTHGFVSVGGGVHRCGQVKGQGTLVWHAAQPGAFGARARRRQPAV